MTCEDVMNSLMMLLLMKIGFVDRDFNVNDANVENMVETNTRDDLYDDLLRNEMTSEWKTRCSPKKRPK